MTDTFFRFPLALALATALVSCGGGTDDTSGEGEAAGTPMTVLKREDPPAPTGSGAETATGTEGTAPKPIEEAAVSREEAARRRRFAQAHDALKAATNSDDRAEALASLQAYGPMAKACFELITAALQDEEPFTRGQALITAATADPERARPLLMAGLADRDSEIRRMAIEAFEKGGYPDLETIVLRQKDEVDGSVQLAALLVAERSGADRLKPHVLAVLESLTPPAASAAVRYLVKVNATETTGVLAPLLTRGTPDLRLAVVAALVDLKASDKPTLLALTEGLMDEELSVRRGANSGLQAPTGNEVRFTPDST
ncbi:MAG TPA: hypothetical protein PKA37_18140, partial [Planctomycetota bacterium]|nr:hypothetical protein [Planctomycetota bacterium]